MRTGPILPGARLDQDLDQDVVKKLVFLADLLICRFLSPFCLYLPGVSVPLATCMRTRDKLAQVCQPCGSFRAA